MEPNETGRPRIILSISTEWWSMRGGISTVNRLLCQALAKKGAVVYCFVLDPSEQERADAAANGVQLISAKCPYGSAGQEALSRRPALPDGVVPDLVIGHGRITGRPAAVMVSDHFKDVPRLHILHMAPDQTAWLKPDLGDDAGLTAEQRMKQERALLRPPALCAGIGPQLTALGDAELAAFPGAHRAIRIDPGFDIRYPEPRRPPGGSPIRVLIVGRMEDWPVKGLDIAVRGLAEAVRRLGPDAANVELVVRGVQNDQFARIRRQAGEWAGKPPFRVVPRTYTVDSDELRQEFLRATLVLVPSRADGFAFVGTEAIVAGTPVLVSAACGLAELLCEVLGREADNLVVPVHDDAEEDTMRWGEAIAAVLKDRERAFENAERIRKIMARERTWAMAADAVLRVIS